MVTLFYVIMMDGHDVSKNNEQGNNPKEFIRRIIRDGRRGLSLL
jgi:hypothetical protein